MDEEKAVDSWIDGSPSGQFRKLEKSFYFKTDYQFTAKRESVNLADLNVAVFMKNLLDG